MRASTSFPFSILHFQKILFSLNKTRSLAYATRTSLAASVRPCCRRRSASRLLATSSRSRAPLQSRNRARSLLSGPTKRGSRAWRRARRLTKTRRSRRRSSPGCREATRYISISQFGAAGWLDMRPDGLHHTKMVSAMFLTAIQRTGTGSTCR